MGQKVNPTGFRVGVINAQSSNWYAKPKDYSLLVLEDIFVRNFINAELVDTGVSLINIERKADAINLNIQVARPGALLSNQSVDLDSICQKLKKELARRLAVTRHIEINISEVSNADSNAKLLADFISEQLEKRVPFRRVIRSAIQRAQQAGVKGIKIQVAGRLNGAEIARSEWVREGQVPLQTLNANIDYCSHKARTIYGILGIKVWIYNP